MKIAKKMVLLVFSSSSGSMTLFIPADPVNRSWFLRASLLSFCISEIKDLDGNATTMATNMMTNGKSMKGIEKKWIINFNKYFRAIARSVYNVKW